MFNGAKKGNEHTGLAGKETQGPGPIPALVLQEAEQMGRQWWSQTYPPAFLTEYSLLAVLLLCDHPF